MLMSRSRYHATRRGAADGCVLLGWCRGGSPRGVDDIEEVQAVRRRWWRRGEVGGG